jgi:hypothetical protein
MILTSRSLLLTPEQLIFSDKLSEHQTYLYSMTLFKAAFAMQNIVKYGFALARDLSIRDYTPTLKIINRLKCFLK